MNRFYKAQEEKKLNQLEDIYDLANKLSDSWNDEGGLKNFNKAIKALDDFLYEFEIALEKEETRKAQLNNQPKFDKELCAKFELSPDDPKTDTGCYLNQRWCSIDNFRQIARDCNQDYNAFEKCVLRYVGAESPKDDCLYTGCYVNGHWFSPSVVLDVADSAMKNRSLRERLDKQTETQQHKKEKQTPEHSGR